VMAWGVRRAHPLCYNLVCSPPLVLLPSKVPPTCFERRLITVGGGFLIETDRNECREQTYRGYLTLKLPRSDDHSSFGKSPLSQVLARFDAEHFS